MTDLTPVKATIVLMPVKAVIDLMPVKAVIDWVPVKATVLDSIRVRYTAVCRTVSVKLCAITGVKILSC